MLPSDADGAIISSHLAAVSSTMGKVTFCEICSRINFVLRPAMRPRSVA